MLRGLLASNWRLWMLVVVLLGLNAETQQAVQHSLKNLWAPCEQGLCAVPSTPSLSAEASLIALGLLGLLALLWKLVTGRTGTSRLGILQVGYGTLRWAVVRPRAPPCAKLQAWVWS